MSFIQPPFWASPRRRVLQPAVAAPVASATIVGSSVANPTVLTTTEPHGLWTGDTVTIAGHTGSTPALDGSHVVTVLTPTTFTVPLNVTGGGTGGTVTPTTLVEPLTLADVKLLAGLDWMDGDPRDAVMLRFLRSARKQVEHDTGLAIRLRVRDVFLDAIDEPYEWPAQTLPLQSVVSIRWVSAAEVATVVASSTYQVELPTGRIALVPGQVWPTGEFRSLSPWVVRTVAGYASIAAIPEDLVHAIGVLTAHYATAGRDVVITGTIVNTVPMGYDAIIQPHRHEAVT